MGVGGVGGGGGVYLLCNFITPPCLNYHVDSACECVFASSAMTSEVTNTAPAALWYCTRKLSAKSLHANYYYCIYLFIYYWVIYDLIYYYLFIIVFAMSSKAIGSCFEDEIVMQMYSHLENVLYATYFTQ